MRTFKVPEWIEPLRCRCGGEILLQPWAPVVGPENEYKQRSSILGLNFICLGCHKQEDNTVGDWAYLVDEAKFEELYQQDVLKKG